MEKKRYQGDMGCRFICVDRDSNGCSTPWNPDLLNYLAWYGVYIFRPDEYSEFYDPLSGAIETA